MYVWPHACVCVSSCLFNHGRVVATRENFGEEERHVTEVLKANGYPEHIIRMVQRPRERKQDKKTPNHMICLPYMYMSGLSEDLIRVYKMFDISTVFTKFSTSRQQLIRVKAVDPPLSKTGVVYKVPCSGRKEYIGETKRALGTHIKECQTATKRGETEKSATCIVERA